MRPRKPVEQRPSPDPDAALADLRILIIEDMGLIALELQRRLKQLNCKVVGLAARFDEAAALAQTLVIDGVLLDLNLAGRDSYPIAVILEGRGIPFILISGYARSQLRAEFATAAHLQKPFTTDELRAVLMSTFV